MKKLFVLSLSVVLLGGGCVALDTNTEGEVDVTSTPPAISMTAGGNAVAGVEGSYCYGPMCVDKIGPVDLVAESGLNFKTTSRSMAFSSEGDISTMSVNLLDEDGEGVHESELSQNASGSFEYSAPSNLPTGDYYVMVFAQFETGGDVSYIFPVHFE